MQLWTGWNGWIVIFSFPKDKKIKVKFCDLILWNNLSLIGINIIYVKMLCQEVMKILYYEVYMSKI